jgi:predicted Rossmann-fold nucleotide-binding protein
VVLPGGIGTLEEVVELLSWRRLDLHFKPVVFYNPDDFWEPLFALFRHVVAQKLTPPAFLDSWDTVERIEDIVPALRRPRAQISQMAPAIAEIT